MKNWTSTRTRILKAVISFLLALFTLTKVSSGTAQGPDNAARFGLVNAYEAPAAADASGAGWELLTLRWDQLQPNSPAEWLTNPSIDEAVNQARRDNREVVAVLIGTPGWATAGEPGTGVPTGLYSPVSGSENVWASFVRQAINYYVARGVNRYVIWSDVDIPSGNRDWTWDGSLKDYYVMVKVAYRVANEINPNIQIHLSGTGTYDRRWLTRFLSVAADDLTAPTNGYYFDVVSLHHFFTEEDLYSLIRGQFVVMENAGIPLKEVWVNQTNARPAIDPEVYPEGLRFDQYRNISVQQQAAYIVHAYALSFAANRGARVAVYRLVDNLEEDDPEAYGMLREDGSRRPAYTAYQLAARHIGGFTFARRLEEETHPDVEYIRFTFESKVTHVAWARGEQTSTLVIPARTREATLLDMHGNQWIVEPENGTYRIVVPAAECDDPQVGCLIGGEPWFLVEEDIPNALEASPETSSVATGGTPPTPDPSMIATATARAQPSLTPTVTATATSPEQEVENVTPTTTATPVPNEVASETDEVDEIVSETTSEPTTAPADTGTVSTESGNSDTEEVGAQTEQEPTILRLVLPFILVGLGVLSIGFGVWYYLAETPIGRSVTRKRLQNWWQGLFKRSERNE